jgi:hypothetical protein
MAVPTARPTPTRALPDDHGWFGWNIARGTAVWSSSVHRLHGYRTSQVIPSSTLTFHHKHPDDLYGCVDALHAGMLESRLVVHEHRLVDAYGLVREVVMVCRAVRDDQGRTRNLRGFLLPTDAEARPDAGGRSGQASLVPVLSSAFDVSERAARVLLLARRPMTARRSREQRDFASRHAASGPALDLRDTLADSLFPLEHLTLEPHEPLGLAA